jgi:hypothetical protein
MDVITLDADTEGRGSKLLSLITSKSTTCDHFKVRHFG